MAPLEACQVNRERDENTDMKCDPKPNARRHGGNRFTLEQRSQRELPCTIAGLTETNRIVLGSTGDLL
jgi:hypothetical protein